MPVTPEQPAPYAPASAVLSLIERHRNRGLPSPVDADVLARAGISDSLIPRTIQALAVLDLVTEDGKPSPVLEGIRLAPEAEYQQRLTDWLTAAYADALSFVDPATDDEGKIRDAFRKYKPVGQQDRMVTLFSGLCTAAGMMPERPKKQAAPRKTFVVKRPPQPKIDPPPRQRHNPANHGAANQIHIPGTLPPALAGLLASLPSGEDGWTQDRRDIFVKTFGTVLDFCVPIVEATTSNQQNGG